MNGSQQKVKDVLNAFKNEWYENQSVNSKAKERLNLVRQYSSELKLLA